MKPERARELYSDYAEGTLSPALQLALEQHFAGHPDDRADYDEFQRVCTLINETDAEWVDVPVSFRANVLAMAEEELARREAAPAQRAAVTLTGWFRTVGPRRVTGGMLAALAVAALAGVFLVPGLRGPVESGLMPPPMALPAAQFSTIRDVTTQNGTDGNLYHLFHVHLPPDIPSATVSAYVVTSTDQIMNPTALAQATPALTPSRTVTNDEELQIPVALLRQVPVGTTLNLLVQWQPSDSSKAGAQVIFAPVQPGATAYAPPSTGNFYDALQAIASAYGVTVVADASPAINQAVTPPSAPTDAATALASVAGQVNATVRPLTADTYQVISKTP